MTPFRRVFMLIDTGRFEPCCEAWARSFGAILDREVVAIGTKPRSQAHALMTCSGPCSRPRSNEPRIVFPSLCQRQVGDKSNQITVIPELLDVLDIKGGIITLDAMGCQRTIAAKILEIPAGKYHSNDLPQIAGLKMQSVCRKRCHDGITW
jgi:hypothetical protein